jgi:hypothetical protein
MNSTSQPLISIVVPTRDRPDFARLALEALRQQSFDDFEVILSDNAVRRPFEPDPSMFDGVKFRYVRPPAPVWMCDHYEFAVGHARGRYVGILGDKGMLVRHALERVAREIRDGEPDAVSWRVGNYQPSTSDPGGHGYAVIPKVPAPPTTRVRADEALEFLLGTYLEPGFAGNHQLEIRGSIYHGVYSTGLLQAVRARFGRVFRFYAPDLTAQGSALQVARDVRQIPVALELALAGPSNGFDTAVFVSRLLETQKDAARGASGPAPSLIPGLTASYMHLLACDMAAVSGRSLRTDQWEELHLKATHDLYFMGGWPEPGMRERERAVLWKSAERFGPGLRNRMFARALAATRARWLFKVKNPIRRQLGERNLLRIRAALAHNPSRPARQEFHRLSDALQGLPS